MTFNSTAVERCFGPELILGENQKAFLIEMWNSIFPNLLLDEGELIKTSERS